MKLGGSGPGRPARLRRCLFAAGGVLVLGGLGLWWERTNGSSPKVPAPVSLRTAVADVSRRVRDVPAVTSRSDARKEQGVDSQPSNATVVSRTALMPESSTGDHAVPDDLRKPHPITPQHQRIFEENSRIAAMSYAMDKGDFVALRRLNSQDRKDYPEDADALKEGYDLIADCLERRTPRAIAAARRFWQLERGSSLRRYVRRHCLEGPAPT